MRSPSPNPEEESIMTVIKAAAVQISPVLYSREGTVEKVVQKIHELGKLGVQFATFPETVVPYYPYFSFVQTPFDIRTGNEYLKLLDQSVVVPSATTHAIGDAAKQARMVVSIGVNERDGGSHTPESTIHLRSVSRETSKPCRSRRASAASVGPKSR